MECVCALSHCRFATLLKIRNVRNFHYEILAYADRSHKSEFGGPVVYVDYVHLLPHFTPEESRTRPRDTKKLHSLCCHIPYFKEIENKNILIRISLQCVHSVHWLKTLLHSFTLATFLCFSHTVVSRIQFIRILHGRCLMCLVQDQECGETYRK